MRTWLAAKQADTPIDEAIAQARCEMPNLDPATPIVMPERIRHNPYAAELFIRLIFSALVDADSLDTEQHWRRDTAGLRGSQLDLHDLWQRFEQDQTTFTHDRPASGLTVEVDGIRNSVYRDCLRAADSPPGLFKLNVPTGGGKTRSGMAFALQHAIRNNQQRIIVAVPFITITEQNRRHLQEHL